MGFEIVIWEELIGISMIVVDRFGKVLRDELDRISIRKEGIHLL